jgi:hypothetical protein
MNDHTDEFLQRHGLARPYCGASFGPGWTKLLDALVVDLKKLEWDGQVDQIKEKFGGLRFYVGDANHAIYERIDDAERESLRTCEECGAPGKVRGGGWIKTLCDDHAEGRLPMKSWTEQVAEAMAQLSGSQKK